MISNHFGQNFRWKINFKFFLAKFFRQKIFLPHGLVSGSRFKHESKFKSASNQNWKLKRKIEFFSNFILRTKQSVWVETVASHMGKMRVEQKNREQNLPPPTRHGNTPVSTQVPSQLKRLCFGGIFWIFFSCFTVMLILRWETIEERRYKWLA